MLMLQELRRMHSLLLRFIVAMLVGVQLSFGPARQELLITC
jgi:hypothetical protein